MTVRSVYEIDLRSDKFTAFYALFQKYQDALKKIPAQWGQIGRAVDQQALSFVRLAEASSAVNLGGTGGKRAEETTKKLRADTQPIATNWQGIARDAKRFASSVKDATLNFTKWVGVGGIVSGLLGAGGLWGIDELGEMASGWRRQSLGLGINPGERNAFKTNFERIVDPDSFLTNVNTALTDVTKRYVLYGAGLNEGQIKGKDTAQVAASLIPALKKFADRTPLEYLATTMKAFGIDQLMSVQDMQRLKNTPQSEIADLIKNYGKDKSKSGLDPSRMRAWQDFTTQMTRASYQIKSVFIDKLGPLAPSLTHLSESFAHAVSQFLDVATKNHWIDTLSKWIDSFATNLGNGKFDKDMKTFADDVGYAARKIVSALAFLGLIPDAANPPPTPAGSDGHSETDTPQQRAAEGARWNKYKRGQAHTMPARAVEAIDYLMRKGRSNAYAAGMVGALLGENSTFDPTLTDYKDHTRVGLEQADTTRRRDFLRRMHVTMQSADWRKQLDFFDMEVQGKAGDKGSAAAGREIAGMTDARRIAAIITEKALRPSPGEIRQSEGYRMAAAAKLASSPVRVVVKIDNAAGANTVVTGSQLGRAFQ